MAVIARKTGVTRINVPDGLHPAVCIGVYDIGTHQSKTWGNWSRNVVIVWELPEQLMTDGRPLTISRQYTLSLHKKAGLRADLEKWRNRPFTEEEVGGFDLLKLLGKPCQIQVMNKVTNGEKYSNVAGIMMPTGKPVKATNPLRSYSIDDNGKTIPDGIPEWIVNKIKASQEWTQQPAGHDDASDEYQTDDDADGTPF